MHFRLQNALTTTNTPRPIVIHLNLSNLEHIVRKRRTSCPAFIPITPIHPHPLACDIGHVFREGRLLVAIVVEAGLSAHPVEAVLVHRGRCVGRKALGGGRG